MADVEYLSYEIIEERGWDLNGTDPFEKAADADLDREEHGRIEVSEGESILDAAERENLGWSLKCLRGRCGRCSAVTADGTVDMDPEQEFLTREEVEIMNLSLPCVSSPETDVKLVYGARRLDRLEDRVK